GVALRTLDIDSRLHECRGNVGVHGALIDNFGHARLGSVAGDSHALGASRYVDGQGASRIRLSGGGQGADSRAVQRGLGRACAVENVAERGECAGGLLLRTGGNAHSRVRIAAQVVLGGHAGPVSDDGLVLQAGYDVLVAAHVADHKALAAVVVGAGIQGRRIDAGDLLGALVGDALDRPVRGYDAGIVRAVLVRAFVEGAGGVTGLRQRGSGLHGLRAGQIKAADAGLSGTTRLKTLAQNLGQYVRNALALGFQGGGAVGSLGKVAKLRITAGQRDILPQDDLIRIHRASYSLPASTVVLIGRLLVGNAADDGSYDKHITGFWCHIAVLSEVRLDD